MSKTNLTAHLEKNVISNVVQMARASAIQSTSKVPKVSAKSTISLARPPSLHSTISLKKDTNGKQLQAPLLSSALEVSRKRNFSSESNRIRMQKQESLIENIPPELSETKEILTILDQMKKHEEVRFLYTTEDVEGLMRRFKDNIKSVEQNKNEWISPHDMLLNLMFLLETMNSEPLKLLEGVSCILYCAIDLGLISHAHCSNLAAEVLVPVLWKLNQEIKIAQDENTDIFDCEEKFMKILVKVPLLLLQPSSETITQEALNFLCVLSTDPSLSEIFPLLELPEILLFLADSDGKETQRLSLELLKGISQSSKASLYTEEVFIQLFKLLSESSSADPGILCLILEILKSLFTPSKNLVPWQSIAGGSLSEAISQFLRSLKQACEGEELPELLSLTTSLLSMIPEALIECEFPGCGRKFSDEEKLEEHIRRRHK